MPQVATRVLIINRQIKFSATLKQALDQTGQFEVSPFTSANAALDFLKNKPQHVALVDFNVTDMRGLDIVLQLRATQPDLAIILSPNQSETSKIAHDLDLQGVIDMPITARKLIPILDQAYNYMRDSLPDTRDAPAIGNDSDTLTIQPPPMGSPEFSSLDSVLVHIGGLSDELGTSTLPVDMDSAGYAVNNNQLQAPRSIEFVIRDDLSELEKAMRNPSDPNPQREATEAVTLFQQLAAEEPPLPKFEDSGTVGDLMIGVGDTNLREVVKILKQNKDQPQLPLPPKPIQAIEEPEQAPESNTARMILSKALDQTTPLTLSLEEILKDIDEIDDPNFSKGKARLLGGGDVERFVREPDFLPDESREIEESITDGQSNFQTTNMAHPEELVSDPENLETDVLAHVPPPPQGLPEHSSSTAKHEVVEESEPDEQSIEAIDDDIPFSLSESIPDEIQTGPIDPEDEIEHQTAFGTQPLAVLRESEDVYESESVRVQSTSIIAEDVDIPALALGLTQASVDLTADATILAREGRIIDFAGKLAQEDIEDLGEEIQNDWEANQQEARIRFVNLRSSGEDYMLYSRHTEDGYTLTLVFAGNMPLRAVRRQYDQLVEALYTIPDEAQEDFAEDDADIAQMEAELEEIESNTSKMQAVDVNQLAQPDEVIALTVYTFVWLVRDYDMNLDGEMAIAIVDQLDEQLSNIGWDVQALRVHEDFVYIMAGVPGEEPANDIIINLKKRTGKIAQSVDDGINSELVWADSYLAFVPGRELEVVEIQRYINFARARE